MGKLARLRILTVLSLSLGMGALTGCQTWMAGMTLPSGHYIDGGHNPQYFPEDPRFPLERELAYQEEAAGLLQPANKDRGKGAAPVPGAPLPGAAPVPVPPR